MFERQIRQALIVGLLVFCVQAIPALAHGDKVIPQVPDGPQSDGTSYRTKFDFTNLGPLNGGPVISKVKVLFYTNDGKPWSIATNLGTASSFTLNMGQFQTLRLETQGKSAQLTAGYVIVQNNEATTTYAEDYEVAITAYYEVSKSGQVIDTVSVPVGQPTVAWVLPAQVENSQSIYTGFAIVNLSGKSNNVTLEMYRASTSGTGPATKEATKTFPLTTGQQRAVLLTESTLFPTMTSFKGMMLGYSEGPVAILALLLTPTAGAGVQFATMVPAYADALRRNTYMYLRQGTPMDADIPVVDYFVNDDDQAPWDLLYETDTTNYTKRRLSPQQGALFASLGKKDETQFDNITIEDLRALNYTISPIDLSDSSANLTTTYAFAIKTSLGRYVKVRIADIITRSDSGGAVYKDLALEVYIYK